MFSLDFFEMRDLYFTALMKEAVYFRGFQRALPLVAKTSFASLRSLNVI